MTLTEKAQFFRGFFELKKFDEKIEKWINTNSENQNVIDLIYATHDNILPDDFKYEKIVETLDLIIDNDLNEENFQDAVYELMESSIYTSDLTSWLNSNNTRVYFLTEALQNYGCTDGFELLSLAQKMEIEEIAGLVFNYLAEYEGGEDEE